VINSLLKSGANANVIVEQTHHVSNDYCGGDLRVVIACARSKQERQSGSQQTVRESNGD
jgi:hypothetical protein